MIFLRSNHLTQWVHLELGQCGVSEAEHFLPYQLFLLSVRNAPSLCIKNTSEISLLRMFYPWWQYLPPTSSFVGYIQPRSSVSVPWVKEKSVAILNIVEYNRKALDFKGWPMKCDTSSARFPETFEIGELYHYGRTEWFKTNSLHRNQAVWGRHIQTPWSRLWSLTKTTEGPDM